MRGFATRRASRSVVIGFIILATQAFTDAHAAAPFTISIAEPVSVVGLTVTLSGAADSPAGEASGNYVLVEWGDGTSTQLPNFTGSGPWGWGPMQHTYASGGAQTITATMMHASPNGRDASKSADQVTITPATPVIDEEPPVVIDEEPPVIEEEPPVIIEEEPPVVIDEEPPVVIDEEPPVVIDEEPPVVIDEEPPVIEDETPVIEDETPIEYEIPSDENLELDGAPEAATPELAPAVGIGPAVLGTAHALPATGTSTVALALLGLALVLGGTSARLHARPKR